MQGLGRRGGRLGTKADRGPLICLYHRVVCQKTRVYSAKELECRNLHALQLSFVTTYKLFGYLPYPMCVKMSSIRVWLGGGRCAGGAVQLGTGGAKPSRVRVGRGVEDKKTLPKTVKFYTSS